MGDANKITRAVPGAPFQPGEQVRVVRAVDPHVFDVAPFVGSKGSVEYLEYSCGCGQTYPDRPMIGVLLNAGMMEFWPEELSADGN